MSSIRIPEDGPKAETPARLELEEHFSVSQLETIILQQEPSFYGCCQPQRHDVMTSLILVASTCSNSKQNSSRSWKTQHC